MRENLKPKDVNYAKQNTLSVSTTCVQFENHRLRNNVADSSTSFTKEGWKEGRKEGRTDSE